MAASVGFLTIGQSPRDDVVGEIREILRPAIEIVQKGALDGLSALEIRELRPEKDFPLLTRLRDGTSTVIGRKKAIPLLQKQISELEGAGVGLIGLLCTGEFPELKSGLILLRPSQILFHWVNAVSGKGRACVLAPLPDQEREVRKKWERSGLKVVFHTLNPYRETEGEDDLIKKIDQEGVDLVVLDCIGYGLRVKEKIRRVTGKPVFLPRTILARMINELT